MTIEQLEIDPEQDPLDEQRPRRRGQKPIRKAEPDLELLSEDQRNNLEAIRARCESDSLWFCRDALGFTSSVIEWSEFIENLETGKREEVKRRIIKEGEDYGLSPNGPHRHFFDFLAKKWHYKHVEEPRDAYKSTGVAGWVIDELRKDRNLRGFWGMDTLKEARKKVRFIEKLIMTEPQSRLLRVLWPDFYVESYGENDSFFISGRTRATSDPSLEPGGVDSDITGSHRDIIVLDDAVNYQNVRTRDGIKKTRDYFRALIHLLDPGGIYLVVGTRYDDADLYGEILRTMARKVGGDWECLVEDAGVTLYQDDNRTWQIRGEPRFKHLDAKVLKSRLDSVGPIEFSLHYCNRPLSTGQQIFHRHQFQSERWDPEWMCHLRWHILTDTATTEVEQGRKDGTDPCYTVVALVGLDSADNAYLADLYVGRVQTPIFAIEACNMYERWRGKGCQIAQMCLEATTLNRAIRPQLEAEMRRRQLNFLITPTPRGTNEGSKDQRIEGMATRFHQRRFFVLDTVPPTFNNGYGHVLLWSPDGYQDESGAKLPDGELVEHFIRHPVGRYKDIADAMSDIDAMIDGVRVCHGSGKRQDIRSAMMEKVGRPVHVIRGPASGRGDKWDVLFSRIGRRVG